jgi:hypothetical protein
MDETKRRESGVQLTWDVKERDRRRNVLRQERTIALVGYGDLEEKPREELSQHEILKKWSENTRISA